MRLDDRKALFRSEFKNEFGDVFRRRVVVNQTKRLAEFLKRGNGRVIAAQNHAVVQLIINPTTHNTFNVGEVEHHAAVIQRSTFQHNHSPTVVTVQVSALAVVIHQSVAVAEIDFPCDTKHKTLLCSVTEAFNRFDNIEIVVRRAQKQR